MSFWHYAWPIGLIVLSNVFYHITTKTTPQNANAFLSLTVTYLVGGVVSFLAYFMTAGKGSTWKMNVINAFKIKPFKGLMHLLLGTEELSSVQKRIHLFYGENK